MNDIASKLGVSLKSVIYFMQINNLKRRNYQEANNNFFQHKPLSFNIKKQLKNKERELLIKAVMIY
ncbi:MAG: hypothetical protein PHT24_07670 [Endomicrobiaceae bacterium]|nr:hypothetical protein [Endomicrobiaceae bacterium]